MQMFNMIMTKPQIQIEGSDVTSTDWTVLPPPFDHNKAPENINGFGSMLEEMPCMSCVVDESNLEFEMPFDMDSLMQGELKREMDLLEMICLGKL
ncbi:hypothetical protein SLA2020_269040 [Shorea laevis]